MLLKRNQPNRVYYLVLIIPLSSHGKHWWGETLNNPNNKNCEIENAIQEANDRFQTWMHFRCPSVPLTFKLLKIRHFKLFELFNLFFLSRSGQHVSAPIFTPFILPSNHRLTSHWIIEDSFLLVLRIQWLWRDCGNDRENID